ncbi:MAG TPA: 2-hydroxyacyl-CoA dehydratase [Dehalococcoidia bacterium]|nr:2-hydroxyacyl-CoA dehydratase [Dehalococcoidia bacterium]
MEAMDRLMSHVRERPVELMRLKQEGAKIVGYVPNGYMPEEIAHASGVIPVGLIRGGDHEPVAASQAYLFRLLDTFCRSQIGYRTLGEEPLYQLPDLLVVPITDRNVTAIAESWQLYTDVEVLRFGVPRYTGAEHAFEYYVDGLRLLKRKLEEITGAEIKDERLQEEIELSNSIRGLLEGISFTRASERPLISGRDFIRLNHATYYADRHILVSALESIASELKKLEPPRRAGPKIMLVGSTMADGDYKVVDILEDIGANIVIEEFSEGVRHYQQKVGSSGDPIRALADRYLRRRVPPAIFHGAVRDRFRYLLELVKEFKVDGVVWYSLLYRDSYDREGLLFHEELKKKAGIPLLKLTSDYDIAETGPMRTRIETFIDIIRQRG